MNGRIENDLNGLVSAVPIENRVLDESLSVVRFSDSEA
jgi:hypothetical protein